MQLVILAGGKGTRLGLKDIPKPMCPIAGKPLLERQVELASTYGIDEIFILSGFKAEVIRDYFGDGQKWGVKIHHEIEPYPLGTAGSLKTLEGRVNGRFMVFYGDVVMDFDLQAFMDFDAAHPETVGTLIVHPGNHPYDSDLVEMDHDGNITGFLPKPHAPGLLYRNLGNAAVYIFGQEIFSFIEPDVSSDLGKHVFPRIIAAGKALRGYHTPEFIRDMGTPERLASISEDYADGKVARKHRRFKRPAVFLDRDGTLNVNMDSSPTVEGLTLLPGAAEAVRRINESGRLAVVVTNQPMIAKGFTTFEEVELMNKKLETLLGNERAYVDAIYFCPHHPHKGFEGEVPELKVDCDCRKPKPGMLLQAAERFNIDLAASWMIGDSDADIQAGEAAGCRSLLIGRDAPDVLSAVNIALEGNA